MTAPRGVVEPDSDEVRVETDTRPTLVQKMRTWMPDETGGIGASGLDRWAPLVFLALALPIGLAYVLLVPPSQVIDERSHFLRTWQLAELNLRVDQHFDDGSGRLRNGAVYDDCVVEYLDGFQQRAGEDRDFTTGSFWFDTPDCSPQRRHFFNTDAALTYGPWSYPGQIVGVAAGRAAGLPLPVTFFLGRITGLLVYLGAVVAALRIVPRARLGILVIALLPMSMMTAAAYNTDGVMLGGTILAIACALRFALRPVARPRALLAVMAVALAMVVATKPNYAPLVGLLALVPTASLGRPRSGRLALVGVAGAILVSAWFVNRVLQGQPTGEIFYPGTDPGRQLGWMITHPVGFLQTVWRTLFSYESEVYLVRGWVGVFGMLRTGRPGVAPLLAMPFVVVAFCTFALAAVAEGGLPRAMPRSTRLLRLGVSLAIIVGGVLSVFAVAFMFWTQPGSSTIEGVQARYLLPYVAMIPGAIALTRHRSDMFVSLRVVTVLMLFITAVAFQHIGDLFY